ncbi:MAG TPA: FkbM family methyltransferase, partial [Segetibacter sp.]
MQSKLFVTNILTGAYKKLTATFNNADKKADLTWFKTKYLKHASPKREKIYRYKKNNIHYSHPIELLHTLREIFIEEIYRIELPPKALIIDCGANIGLGIIYLKEQYPDAHVIAFEPDENNFELLKKNIASFKLQNVDARKEAVWIADSELHFSNDGTMGSRIELSGTGDTRKVKAIKLASLLNNKIHFLKIDIEGAEYTVIKDLKDSLSNVENVFLEYHGDFSQNNELTEIFNIMQGAGFSYYIKEAAEIYKN